MVVSGLILVSVYYIGQLLLMVCLPGQVKFVKSVLPLPVACCTVYYCASIVLQTIALTGDLHLCTCVLYNIVSSSTDIQVDAGTVIMFVLLRSL